jgi:Uma2 family endonuclease
MGWLSVYKAATPGVRSGDNSTVRLDLDNEPQPDGLLRIAAECGGRSRIDEDGYVAAAPELTAEIAASSASYDMHRKLNAYRRNEVQEYVVFLTEERRVRWFRLREGQYVELPADSDGIVRSEVFPGLWLDAPALVAGNLARVLEVLQRGIAMPEHAAFVEQLQAGRIG